MREIVTSATYRQTLRSFEGAGRKRPVQSLARPRPAIPLAGGEHSRPSAVRRRLALDQDARPVRSPVAAEARPSSAFGGSTDWDTSPGEDKYRRGLYTSWRRTTPYPSMTTFDATSREVCTIRRIRTNTPLQALVTLNDPVYVEAAQALRASHRARRRRRRQRPRHLRLPPRASLARRATTNVRGWSRCTNNCWQRYRADSAAAMPLATDPLGPVPQGMDVAELAAWTVVGNVLLNLDEALARR